MYYADVDGGRKTATPGSRGTCPGCGSEVLAKCGEIKSWHWAHAADAQCDPWHHGETDWHLAWKRLGAAGLVRGHGAAGRGLAPCRHPPPRRPRL